MLTVFKTSSQAEIASDPKTSLTKNQSLTWVFSILIHLECGSGVRHAPERGFLKYELPQFVEEVVCVNILPKPSSAQPARTPAEVAPGCLLLCFSMGKVFMLTCLVCQVN